MTTFVIAGGTGQIGTMLARHYHERGDTVVVLGRRAPKQTLPWAFAQWDAKTLGDWASSVDGADVVINLAGRSVNCRHTPANKILMMDSRVDSTRVMGEAIAQAAHPPALWLQASTATIYAHRFDAPNDEHSGLIGSEHNAPGAHPSWGFSIKISNAWERALADAQTPHTRKVALRMAMTMSPDKDGVFDTMRGLVAKGLGGQQGNGKQYVSWVHDEDSIRALDWIIEHEHLSGPINITSPHPIPNALFMKQLRKAWGTSIGLPAAGWMVRIGAVFMGTEAELPMKSRRVIPTVLLEDGFEFNHPTWSDAVQDLCDRYRDMHH